MRHVCNYWTDQSTHGHDHRLWLTEMICFEATASIHPLKQHCTLEACSSQKRCFKNFESSQHTPKFQVLSNGNLVRPDFCRVMQSVSYITVPLAGWFKCIDPDSVRPNFRNDRLQDQCLVEQCRPPTAQLSYGLSDGRGLQVALGCSRNSDDTIHHSFNCWGCIFALSFPHGEWNTQCCFVHFYVSAETELT